MVGTQPCRPPVPDRSWAVVKVDSSQYDPVFIHSRREAVVIFCVWLAALLWAVPFCYLNGYGQSVDPSTFPTVLGIPAWLFWGILAPWLAADAVTIWFCFFYMQDDDLSKAGDAADEPGSRGEAEQ